VVGLFEAEAPVYFSGLSLRYPHVLKPGDPRFEMT
jgi:hypothetical protein